MVYLVLADILVGAHLAYVGYVLFGELLILVGIPLRWMWIRNAWFRTTHLVMILIVAAEAYYEFECPLTTWENQLLHAGGQVQEHRSFVGRLLDNILFFDCGDDSWVWPWIYGGFAALVVLTFIIAPPHWRRMKAQSAPENHCSADNR